MAHPRDMDEFLKWHKAKSEEWRGTAAYEFCLEMGLLERGRFKSALFYAFREGYLSGSLYELEAVAVGRLFVRELGTKSCRDLAFALIEWYKARALPHSQASTSRPEGQRVDGRTPDERLIILRKRGGGWIAYTGDRWETGRTKREAFDKLWASINAGNERSEKGDTNVCE